jgi:uncharacterized membrane protein (UPF0127 family)
MQFGRFLVGAFAVLAACSSRPGESAPAARTSTELAVHPESGLEVVPLVVVHGDKRLPFKVEVAATPAEQARGLMFRTAMGPDEGMIFPSQPPRDGVAFWMKNTVIPLDIIFIGTDGRILNIAANAVPYSLQPIPAAGPVSGVLEINGGRAAQLGIGAGDKVEW